MFWQQRCTYYMYIVSYIIFVYHSAWADQRYFHHVVPCCSYHGGLVTYMSVKAKCIKYSKIQMHIKTPVVVLSRCKDVNGCIYYGFTTPFVLSTENWVIQASCINVFTTVIIIQYIVSYQAIICSKCHHH